MKAKEANVLVEDLVCITGDGFPLSVQTEGPVDAPALLLLPGQANSHRWWDGLRQGFEGFRTITFDYRGTGRSRGPVGRWTTTSFAADAAQVLDRLGVDTVAVYGTSMGGRVAQMLAINHPGRVTALVLACTSPGGTHAVERGADIRLALRGSTPLERLQILGDLFYSPRWPAPPSASPLLGDRTMSAPEAAAHLRASDEHDAWDALPSIAAPTLVLHGEDDRINPVDNALLLAGQIPDAQVQLYQLGRHGFFEEYSETVTPAVISFLTTHHRARASLNRPGSDGVLTVWKRGWTHAEGHHPEEADHAPVQS